MQETFELSELESLYTERAIVNEATKRDTIYKGDYTAQIMRVEPRIASEKSPFPGRKMLNLRLNIPFNGKSVTIFQEVSFEPRRTLTVGGERLTVKPGDQEYDLSLPLDKPSKLWGHLEAAVNPNGKLTVRQVIEALTGSAINVFMLEGFIDSNGTYHWPEADPKKNLTGYEEQRKAFLSAGYQSKNLVSSFRAAK